MHFEKEVCKRHLQHIDKYFEKKNEIIIVLKISKFYYRCVSLRSEIG